MTMPNNKAASLLTRRPQDIRVDDVLRLAPSDPRRAASMLACRIDSLRVHHEGSDLARALHDFAYDPSDDALDVLAYYADRPQGPAGVRLAVATIIAAGKAAGSRARARANLCRLDDRADGSRHPHGRRAWTI